MNQGAFEPWVNCSPLVQPHLETMGTPERFIDRCSSIDTSKGPHRLTDLTLYRW
jgi:hypothetical protein